MPNLPVNSPEMMAFLKNEPPIQCDDVEAWVSCGTDRKVRLNEYVIFGTLRINLNNIFNPNLISVIHVDALGMLGRKRCRRSFGTYNM